MQTTLVIGDSQLVESASPGESRDVPAGEFWPALCSTLGGEFQGELNALIRDAKEAVRVKRGSTEVEVNDPAVDSAALVRLLQDNPDIGDAFVKVGAQFLGKDPTSERFMMAASLATTPAAASARIDDTAGCPVCHVSFFDGGSLPGADAIDIAKRSSQLFRRTNVKHFFIVLTRAVDLELLKIFKSEDRAFDVATRLEKVLPHFRLRFDEENSELVAAADREPLFVLVTFDRAAHLVATAHFGAFVRHWAGGSSTAWRWWHFTDIRFGDALPAIAPGLLHSKASLHDAELLVDRIGVDVREGSSSADALIAAGFCRSDLTEPLFQAAERLDVQGHFGLSVRWLAEQFIHDFWAPKRCGLLDGFDESGRKEMQRNAAVPDAPEERVALRLIQPRGRAERVAVTSTIGGCLPPVPEGKRRLYHGTCSCAAESIIQVGIQAMSVSIHTDFGQGFYTTDVLPIALDYGHRRAEMHGRCLPTVLVFDVDEAEVARASVTIDGAVWCETIAAFRRRDAERLLRLPANVRAAKVLEGAVSQNAVDVDNGRRPQPRPGSHQARFRADVFCLLQLATLYVIVVDE